MSGKLSPAEARLAEIRAARDAARAAMDARLARLKTEMTPERIAGRVIEDIQFKAREVAGQAIEIASDNRGIVAGTASALLLWAARKPLGKAALGWWSGRGKDLLRRRGAKDQPAGKDGEA